MKEYKEQVIYFNLLDRLFYLLDSIKTFFTIWHQRYDNDDNATKSTILSDNWSWIEYCFKIAYKGKTNGWVVKSQDELNEFFLQIVK